ncbi:divalent cation/proton antiporter Gdt1p [Diutina catenulata]
MRLSAVLLVLSAVSAVVVNPDPYQQIEKPPADGKMRIAADAIPPSKQGEDIDDPSELLPAKDTKLNVHDVTVEPKHGSVMNPDDDSDSDEESDAYHSFIMSISMIVVSEIGDKTFLIAALMAMRNSRVVVFFAAFSSLAVMTVLSGIVGHALPTLISQRLTQFLAAGLFVVFGVKLVREALEMPRDMGVDEEMAEVEEEIQMAKTNDQNDHLESGSAEKQQQPWYVELGHNAENLAAFVLSPVFIQVFVMTFLGEWGDRSQIATIAMAAGSEYWMVIAGAIIGHGMCTAAACIGGKLLAKKISMRNVTMGGAIAFFIFAILYFYEAWTGHEA